MPRQRNSIDESIQLAPPSRRMPGAPRVPVSRAPAAPTPAPTPATRAPTPAATTGAPPPPPLPPASIADIECAGPFSVFHDVDRTLALLQGAGLVLHGAGEPLELRAHYEPVEFAGDIPLECSLTDGPVRDFNLMVCRTHARGEVVVVRGSAEALAPARFQLCYAAVGVCECLLAAHVPLALHEGNALLIDSADAPPSVVHINPLSSDAVALAAAIDLIGLAP